MSSLLTVVDNPYSTIALEISKIYAGGTVGIIYDDSIAADKLATALGLRQNNVRCYSIKELIGIDIPEYIRAIVGVGSRRIGPLVEAAKAEIKGYLASDFVIDYWEGAPRFIVFDKERIERRDTLAMASAYSSATGVFATLIDYLVAAHLNVGEPLLELQNIYQKLVSLLLEDTHMDNYVAALLGALEQAYFTMKKHNIYPIIAKDILKVSSRCACPTLALSGEEYCRQEFFASYLLLCIFSLFSKKQINSPLLPKDINAIISLCKDLDIAYCHLFSSIPKIDYMDKFLLLQEEDARLAQPIPTRAQLKRLSFNMRGLVGKEFFKDLSYYDCLCYTLIANEFRQKQGLLRELANSGFIDALMEKASAELSEYKAISI